MSSRLLKEYIDSLQFENASDVYKYAKLLKNEYLFIFELLDANNSDLTLITD